MEKFKYPRPGLTTEEKIDFNDVDIKVEEKLVGEMWSNISGEFAPIADKIQSIREKATEKNSPLNKNNI